MQFTDRKIILGLIVLQLLICLPFIQSFPIALDEPFSIFYAQQDLSEFIPKINEGNNSPLHFILLHFWIKCFGISALSVRSLSLLFSILIIPLLFSLGKRVTNRDFGILIVLIFSFSRFHHYHAMEARMYSLFILLFTALIYQLVKVIFDQKNRLLLITTFNILLFYTHYLSIFVFAAELVLFIVFFKDIRPKLNKVMLNILVTLIGFYPGIKILLSRTQNMNETWVMKPHWTELYGNVIRFFNSTLTLISCILIVVLLIVFNRGKDMLNVKQLFKNKFFKMFFILFGAPYFGMFIFSLTVQPVFLDRYLLFVSIPLYIILGMLLWHFLKGTRFYLTLLIIIPMVVSVNYKPATNRDVQEIAKFTKKHVLDETEIYLSPPWIEFQFYYHYNVNLFKDYQSITTNVEDNIHSIYSLKDIKLSSDLIFINSLEGYVKSDLEIRSYFNKTHELEDHLILNELYLLYSFKVKNGKL